MNTPEQQKQFRRKEKQPRRFTDAVTWVESAAYSVWCRGVSMGMTQEWTIFCAIEPE